LINILDNVTGSENHSYSDNCSDTEPAHKSQYSGWNSDTDDSSPGDADDDKFSQVDTPLFFPSNSGTESESNKYSVQSLGSLLDMQHLPESSTADTPYLSDDEEDKDKLVIEDDPLFRS